MWHAFGGLGHWTEWHVTGRTMRDVLAEAVPKIRAYGHAFIEDPKGDQCWLVSKPIGFSKREYTIRPYKPLQTDWGVEEP